jgi:hypothetical protein
VVENFGAQLEESDLDKIEDELLAMVDQGLLSMGVSEGGEVLFWTTPVGEIVLNML